MTSNDLRNAVYERLDTLQQPAPEMPRLLAGFPFKGVCPPRLKARCLRNIKFRPYAHHRKSAGCASKERKAHRNAPIVSRQAQAVLLNVIGPRSPIIQVGAAIVLENDVQTDVSGGYEPRGLSPRISQSLRDNGATEFGTG